MVVVVVLRLLERSVSFGTRWKTNLEPGWDSPRHSRVQPIRVWSCRDDCFPITLCEVALMVVTELSFCSRKKNHLTLVCVCILFRFCIVISKSNRAVEDSTTPRKEHVRRGRRLDDYLDHERPHIRTYDHTQIRTKQGNSASSAMEAEKAFPEQADTQLQGEVMGNMPIPTTSGGDTKNANSMNMMTPLNEDHKMGNSMMMEDNKMGNSMMNEDHKMGNSMMMEDNKMGNNMMMEDHKMGNNMMNEDHKMGHSMMMEDNKMGNNMMMNEEGKMGNGMHDEPFPEDGKHGNSMMMSGEDKMGNSMMMEDHKMGNHMVMSEEGKMGNSMMNDDSINMGNNMMNGDYHDDTHMKTANSMMNGDYRDETHMKTANSMMNGDYHDETHMKTANSMMNGDYHDDTHMKTANSMRNGDYHDDTHMKTANSMMMDSNHNEMKEGNYVGTPWNGNAKTTTTTGARTGATSASSSRGGWQMTAVNDGNYLGGSNYMAIADTSNGRMPFGIEENAPDYSMFVDAEGHVGLGTSYPSASLHIVGTSPAIKLETEDIYDETSWDVMGKYTNELQNRRMNLTDRHKSYSSASALPFQPHRAVCFSTRHTMANKGFP